MPLPTFQTLNYDDPEFDTSGVKEDLLDDVVEDTPEATDAPEADQKDAPPAAQEVTPPAADPAAETAAEVAPQESSGDEFIPEVPEAYFKLPKGEPIKEDFTDQRISKMDPDGIDNSVSQITDEDAFRREAEAHMALQQGNAPEADYPDWIKKPAVWPAFIEFPSKRDLEAIRVAEEKGKLDDERKDKFNEHFERMSLLMQQRARQIDGWITAENDEILKQEKNSFGIFRSYVKKDLNALRKERDEFEEQRQEALRKGEETPVRDPFFDVKWAVLLDPHASPDDPRFAQVARWGNRTATMIDGGSLRVDDDGMHVPHGDDGSEMAGKMAVLEAMERGWTSIDIAGSEEFVKGAREAAIQAGMGAKITTYYGFIGRSKAEFIMPKPPKMPGIETPQDEAKDAHEDLTKGDGQAPTDGGDGPVINSAAGKAPRTLEAPGISDAPVVLQEPERGADDPVVESPFGDEESPEDLAALEMIDQEEEAKAKADEDEPSPSPM